MSGRPEVEMGAPGVSRFLEKLLDGAEVEWKALGELADLHWLKLGRGQVISKRDLQDFPGNYPVYSSSARDGGHFGRYGKFMFDDERITWSVDGGGRFFYRSNHRYSVTNVSGWMKVFATDRLSTRYLYHVLAAAWEGKRFDYIKKAHPSVIRDEYTIPIPCPDNPKKSLAIQAEIVRILDTFTELTAELTAELTTRRKQYEYYRDQLFNFEEGDVEWKTLGEVGQFIRGKRFTKADYVAKSGVDAIHYGEIYTHYGTWTSAAVSKVRPELEHKLRYAQPGDVVMTGVGEDIDEVGKAVAWLGSAKVAIHDDSYAFRHSLNPKYLSYYMQTARFTAEKRPYVSFAKVKRLLVDGIAKVKIPVPYPHDRQRSIAEQARIASILDTFDTLTTSLTEGLPREIELRQKQYAYYRDLLLSFPITGTQTEGVE